MKPITLSEICQAVNGRWLVPPVDELITISGVTTDSRTVAIRNLYIPIVGETFDGHDFIDQAFAKEAICTLSSKILEPSVEQNVIIVADTKLALGMLAKYYRSLFDIPIVAVTGSVGKTSTKEMLFSVLSEKYVVHKTGGNFNNDIGLPLTLLQLDESHEMAVIEMGMNHFGEIKYLSELTRPQVAVITNIGVSHIEYLGSREGILEAKCEILSGLSTDGLVVLNVDDDMLSTCVGKLPFKTVTYGETFGADCQLTHYESLGTEGQSGGAESKLRTYELKVPFFGKHILMNGLASILVGEHFGLNQSQIIKGVATYETEKMRLNVKYLPLGSTLINDAYNASVDSMKAALLTLCDIAKLHQRKIAILGSMFEMGNYSDIGHSEVGTFIMKKLPQALDVLVCIGSNAKAMFDSAKSLNTDHKVSMYYFDKQETFLNQVENIVQIGDAILVKASRGMHLEESAIQIEQLEESSLCRN